MDGGSTASYAYDHQNRRYKKTVGSTITHYVWQGSQVLAEHNGSTGAVLTDYILSGSRMIAKVAGSTTNYFLSDRLSVRLTMDSNGSVVGRQAHLPFGEDFAESGTQDKHHFTTYERDSESLTDYGVNRQYSAVVGRILRVDPLSESIVTPQSHNRYAYVLSDPLNKIDPLGQFCVMLPGWLGIDGERNSVLVMGITDPLMARSRESRSAASGTSEGTQKRPRSQRSGSKSYWPF